MSEDSAKGRDDWTEVGEQFQALGEGIAGALRAAWEREETRRHVSDLRTGLEGLVSSVEGAIKEFGDSPQGQRLRSEAQRAAGSARSAGETAWQDAQPHIVSALQQVNAELRRVASDLGTTEAGAEATPGETAD
jgi:hypothetical protein